MSDQPTTAAARTRRRATRAAGPTGTAGVVEHRADDHTTEDRIPEPTPTADVDGRAGRKYLRWAALALVAAVLLTPGIVLGVLDHHESSRNALRDQYVQTARQTVVNLTTINGDTATGDLQEMADNAEGDFKNELTPVIKPFVQLIQQAQVTSTGKILEAGLEKATDSGATVLVAAEMMVKDAGNTAPAARDLRFEVTVHNNGGTMSVTQLELVS